MNQFNLFFSIVLIKVLINVSISEPEIPDIFDALKGNGNKTIGYKIIWEINQISDYNTTTKYNNGNSYSVTEYYDIENKKGRLDIIRSDAMNGLFVYFEKTNETFSVKDGSCSSGNIKQKPDFLKSILDEFLYNQSTNIQIIGPSALLRLLNILSQNSGSQRPTFLGQLKDTYNSRYFNGYVWKYEFNINSTSVIIQWLFSDPSNSNIYNYKNYAQPIWISIFLNQSLTKRYEVALFTPYTNITRDSMKRIHIPLSLGCVRNLTAIKDSPIPPQLSNGFSYDMNLEIVTQPGLIFTGNDVHPTVLVNNGRLTYDDTAKLIAWRYEGFKSISNLSHNKSYYENYDEYKSGGFYYEDLTIDTKDNTVTNDLGLKANFSLSASTRTVWDIRTGIIYVLDDNYGNCSIKQKKPNDFLVSVNFKNGYRIPVNSPQLIQSNDFQYMGEFVERGIQVIAYEKRFDNFSIGFGDSEMVERTVVFTHFFAKDNYNDPYVGNDMLLEIGISILYPNENKKLTQVWSATINVNGFTINVDSLDNWSHIKQKAFNVKNCYSTKDLSQWFQLGFPITQNQYMKMYLQSDTIDRQILSYLYKDKDLSISPTRIPISLISWSSNTLYFTALMLERAPFSIDFHNISIGQQMVKKYFKQYLVKNLQECYGYCLDSFDYNCNYLSICDNFMCTLSDSALTGDYPEMIKADNCVTYKKNVKTYSMLTMNMLMSKIEARVQSAPNDVPLFDDNKLGFALNLINSSKISEKINITAVQFKRGFNFGQLNSFTDKIARVYSSEYDRFSDSGITRPKFATKQILTNNDEDCAIACSTEKAFKCKSFDKCDGDGPPLQYNCFLHTNHYMEEIKVENISLNLDQKHVFCGHYSRKYVTDFNVKANVNYAFIDGKSRIEMTDLTVEQCAHQCVETRSTHKCLGFSYCQEINTKSQTKCLLSPTNDHKNTIYYIEDKKCQIYFNGGLSFQLKQMINKTIDNNKNYSKGLGIGIGILDLILGIIVGIFIWMYYKKRTETIDN